MTAVGHDDDDRDDRALLAAHLAGEHEAFGVLFGRHRDRLWAVALRTCRDPEEAADALQDAMVSAFRRAGSFRGDAAVTTWLHRVVVNACLDRRRRAAVRRTTSLDQPRPDGSGGTGPGTPVEGSGGTGPADPADTAAQAERRDAVVAALRTLPAEQRAALVLVDMEGFSVAETAAILDCAPGTVKSRCARGRARLAPLLAGTAARPDEDVGHDRARAAGNPGRASAVEAAAGPSPAPDPKEVSRRDP